MYKLAAYEFLLSTHPLWVGLTKEAVTVDDLYRGTTSANNVKFTSLPPSSPAITFPTRRQMPNAIAQTPLVKGIDAPMTAIRKSRLIPGAAKKKALESLQAAQDNQKRQMRGELAFAPKGGIRINPDKLPATIAALSDTQPVTSTRGTRALAALAASHELAERRVRPKDIVRFRSHFAPEVLLKERNALARLEGPGAEEAVRSLTAAREATGEAQQMRNLLTNVYGDRAAQFLEGNEKVPKAMLRNLRRRLRADPSLIEAADPTASMGMLGKARVAAEELKRMRRIMSLR